MLVLSLGCGWHSWFKYTLGEMRSVGPVFEDEFARMECFELWPVGDPETPHRCAGPGVAAKHRLTWRDDLDHCRNFKLSEQYASLTLIKSVAYSTKD